MTRATRTGWLLVPIALLAGCATLRPSYTVVIENSTGEEIRDAHVSWDGFESVGGVMGPGSRASHAFVDLTVPGRAWVRWRTADGVAHRELVEVPAYVPRRFEGDLIFGIFRDGRVEVRAENSLGAPQFREAVDPAFDRYRDTLFFVSQGRIERVEEALDEGVPAEWEGRGATSLLEEAALSNRPDVAAYLIDRKDLTFSTWRVANALRFAAQDDRVEVLEVLVPRLRPEQLTISDWREALSAACEHGNGSGAVYLIRNSHLDADERLGAFGRNCLYMAVERGNERLVKLLLAEGADPTAKVDDVSMADHASRRGYAAIQEILERAAHEPEAD